MELGTTTGFETVFSGGWATSRTRQFGGLGVGSTYYARVRARNQEGAATGATVLGSTVTGSPLGDGWAPAFGAAEFTDLGGGYLAAGSTTNVSSPDVRIHATDQGAGLRLGWTAPAVSTSTVGLWRMEAGGGLARDGSGRHHHAALNGAAFAGGRFGQGLEFDGAGATAEVADHADLVVDTRNVMPRERGNVVGA